MAQDLNPQDMNTAMKIAITVDRIIFDPTISKQLVQMLSTGNPVEALAKAAAVVIRAMQNKAPTPPARGFQGFLPMIIQRLSELAAAAKIFPPDPNMLKQALAMAQQQGGQPPAAPQPPGGQPPGLINGGV